MSVKSRTLAEEGMIQCKIGPNKDDVGFKKIEDIKYKDRTLGLFLLETQAEIKAQREELDTCKSNDEELNFRLLNLENKLTKIETAIDKIASMLVKE